jgi:hypothetical protein
MLLFKKKIRNNYCPSKGSTYVFENFSQISRTLHDKNKRIVFRYFNYVFRNNETPLNPPRK